MKLFFDYELEFQTQEHWEYRKDAPNFSFAVGSCAYTNEKTKDRPGKSYGQDYFIYNSILDKNPDFMIWLGDNVYLREPDWNTKTGIYHRYSHDRSIKELQPLLGSVHHYAIGMIMIMDQIIQIEVLEVSTLLEMHLKIFGLIHLMELIKTELLLNLHGQM